MDAFDQLIRKLNGFARLSRDDQAALRSLPSRVKTVSSHHFLMRDGDVASDCCVLVKGYACRHKTACDGGRQIVSFHMAGDILNLEHLLLSHADHNVQTITEATIALIPIDHLRRIAQGRTAVNEALWRDTLVDASIFREWVLNVGRRGAKSRIAHMLCEFAVRREAAGLGSPEQFDLPMTQEQIADATGLTAVHVNRMLKELARDGFIIRDKRKVMIVDWRRMCQFADFDGSYLQAIA